MEQTFLSQPACIILELFKMLMLFIVKLNVTVIKVDISWGIDKMGYFCLILEIIRNIKILDGVRGGGSGNVNMTFYHILFSLIDIIMPSLHLNTNSLSET